MSPRYPRIQLILLFYLLSHSAYLGAEEREIWVAPDADVHTADGSERYPFSSLRQADQNHAITPGTIVKMKGGLYRLRIPEYLSLQGTAQSPITITAADDVRPVLDAANMSPDPEITWVDAVLYLQNSAHVKVSGLEIRNAARDVGIKLEGGHDVQIDDNIIEEVYRNAILVNQCQRVQITDNITSRAGLKLMDNRANGIWPNVITVTEHRKRHAGCNDVLIKGNTVSDSYAEGIGVQFSNNVQIIGNTVHDAYSVGIYIDHASDIVIDSNLIYARNPNYFRNGKAMQGIAFANENYCKVKRGRTKDKSEQPDMDCHLANHPVTDRIIMSNNLIVGTSTGIRHYPYNWGLSDQDKERYPQSEFPQIKDISKEVKAENSYSDIVIVQNTILNYSIAGIDIDADPPLSELPTSNVIRNNLVHSTRSSRPILVETRKGESEPVGWTIADNQLTGQIPAYARTGALATPPRFTGDTTASVPDPTAYIPVSAAPRSQPVQGTTWVLQRDFFGKPRNSQPNYGFAEAFGRP